MAPTRELADQICKVVLCLGEFLKIKVHMCCGGTVISEDRRKLQEGVQIVVGMNIIIYISLNSIICNYIYNFINKFYLIFN